MGLWPTWLALPFHSVWRGLGLGLRFVQLSTRVQYHLTELCAQGPAPGTRAVRTKVLDIEEIKALQAKKEAVRAA